MKTYINFAILILVLTNLNVNCVNVCVDVETLTCPNFKNMIVFIDTIIGNEEIPQLQKAIRLIFHDCVSGCNGCVDLDSPDNAGLNCIVGNGNRVFRFAKNLVFYGQFKISLADVYALMAQRAVYLSSIGLTIPVCDFKFGRKTCTSPQENKEIFATSLGNWSHVKNFYVDNFNFSVQEMVAIMGAHSIGRTWFGESGHYGPWVSYNNKVFTNQYYINLLDKENLLEYKTMTTNASKSQWRSAKDSCTGYKKNNCTPKPFQDQRIMLNADMSMRKLFETINESGTPDCTIDTCKDNDESKAWIEKYAASEPEFKKDFGAVFQKLIEWKCEGLVDPETSQNVKFEFEHFQNEKLITLIMKTAETKSTKEQFKIYHYLFKKKYSLNSDEGINRYKIFKVNLKLIKDRNSVVNFGKYGFNKYTDMTNEEYYRAVTGTKGEFIDFDTFADLEMDPFEHMQLDA